MTKIQDKTEEKVEEAVVETKAAPSKTAKKKITSGILNVEAGSPSLLTRFPSDQEHQP